jgi:hypothetical protein
MRLRTALEGHEVVFVTTSTENVVDVAADDLRVVSDSNRDHPLALIRCAAQLLVCMLRERPDVIVSTGAAPGLLGIAIGRVMGAKTMWIDSVANAEELSLSGRLATRVAHRTLTQWAHLARPGGPEYRGSVL